MTDYDYNPILKRIKAAKAKSGLTNEELSARSGIPVGTVNKILSGDTKEPKLPAFIAIADALDTSADYLIYGERSADSFGSVSEDSIGFARKYESLDERGRHVVDAVIGAYSEAPAAPVVQMKDILLLSNSFAAGPADPGSQLDQMERYSVPVDSRADFAIRISGDSMEPWLPDGSVALCRAEMPGLGQIAAVMLDGEFLCKQFVHDNFGNVYLFSLNRKRCELDASVMASGDRDLKIFGTVMVNDRLPAIPVPIGEP